MTERAHPEWDASYTVGTPAPWDIGRPQSVFVRLADEGRLAARFEVADALDLGRLSLTVDTVIDSGVFHVFGDGDRARYVASLAAVLRPAGACYLMCFSDRQPGTWGPRRVRADELRATFSDGWAVESITAGTFEINPVDGTTQVQAWLAAIRRN
jgi:SAM-dependent methyltransferase